MAGRLPRAILGAEGKAMRLAVYGAVLAIALGSVLLGLDWVSAPMSPMVDTEAGLRAVAPPPPPPIAATPPPVAPKATIGAPIVPPRLVAPAAPNLPASPGAAVQVVPPEPIASSEPQVSCKVDACTAAYRSFREADCTYQPSNGPRRLCTK
jgi:hypothetical protein